MHGTVVSVERFLSENCAAIIQTGLAAKHDRNQDDASNLILGKAEVMAETIFQKIIDKEIPAEIVFEDDRCIAFKDINPQAPVHLVVIPKKPIESVDDVSAEDEAIVGHLFWAMRKIAEQEGIDRGYRVVTNCGRDAGQEVMHLHFHMLAGRGFSWPPG